MVKKTICLNMIVKNEAHIIEETLETIYKYIDYYIISDTGSTDNTKDVITNFFNKKNIKGEIHDHEWKDFGYNRSVALKLCKGKSDYIWIIDADDIIVGNLVLPELTKDSYTLRYGSSFTYKRKQIFNNRHNWKYVGVLHEYPEGDKEKMSEGHISGNYYIDSRRLGDRSKDKDKYKKDAMVLEKALLEEPNNSRYMFYLAQSYKDSNNYEKAIEKYIERTKMGGWFEEIFYSYYEIAVLLQKIGKTEEAIKAYVTAYNYLPNRLEPVYELAKHYRLNEDHDNAYKYASIGIKIKYPTNQGLFIDKFCYDFKIYDEYAISSYNKGHYWDSYETIIRILMDKHYPDNAKQRMVDNLSSAINKLGNKLTKNYKKVKKQVLNKQELIPVLYLLSNELNKLEEAFDIYNILLEQGNNFGEEILYYRNLCITVFEDIYCNYPKKIINKSRNSGIALIINYNESFEKTVNSFLNCCLDSHLIQYFYCIGDSKIKETYPFFEFVNEIGNVDSIKYIINIQNHYFYDKRKYINPALELNAKQVFFNKNYREVGTCLKNVGNEKTVGNYIKCKFNNITTPSITNAKTENENTVSFNTLTCYPIQYKQLDNYTVIGQSDSIGYDIRSDNVSLEELEKIANDDVNCIAFNTLGFFKNKISDGLVKMNCDLYVKNIQFEGYELHIGLDSVGYDMFYAPNKTIYELKQMCDANDKCIAFNTQGYLKYKLTDTLTKQSNPAHFLYVNVKRKNKQSVNIKHYENYHLHHNLNSVGYNIKNVGNKSVDELKKMCDEDDDCIGFDTLGNLKYYVVNVDKLEKFDDYYTEAMYINYEKLKDKTFVYNNVRTEFWNDIILTNDKQNADIYVEYNDGVLLISNVNGIITEKKCKYNPFWNLKMSFHELLTCEIKKEEELLITDEINDDILSYKYIFYTGNELDKYKTDIIISECICFYIDDVCTEIDDEIVGVKVEREEVIVEEVFEEVVEEVENINMTVEKIYIEENNVDNDIFISVKDEEEVRRMISEMGDEMKNNIFEVKRELLGSHLIYPIITNIIYNKMFDNVFVLDTVKYNDGEVYTLGSDIINLSIKRGHKKILVINEDIHFCGNLGKIKLILANMKNWSIVHLYKEYEGVSYLKQERSLCYAVNLESEYGELSIYPWLITKYNEVQYKTFCVNMKRRPDRKYQFEREMVKHCINDYKIFDAVDGKELKLTDEYKTLFKNNTFNWRRGVIGCALSHYRLWQQLANGEDDNYLIFEDDIELCIDFNIILNKCLSKLDKNYDLLFLGHHHKNNRSYIGKKIEEVEIKKYDYKIGGTFSYIISKKCAIKMLEYTANNGIIYAIDIFMNEVPNLKQYEVVPNIVFSDYLHQGHAVDTDIQMDFNKLK